MTRLVINADDYGYNPAYDEGILEAAAAGAVDAVSVMTERGSLRAGPLLATGVELGLHLDLECEAAESLPVASALASQCERFERAFGRPPAYLDGHHHCHLRGDALEAVAAFASRRGLIVRSVAARERTRLRALGIATPDLTLGRDGEDQPPLPPELATAAGLPATVEWIVHPGHAAGGGFSSYDGGREQDLETVLAFEPPAGVTRADHRTALGARG